MKHLLIPTDCSVRSLQPVHEALSACEGQQVRITLLHLLHPPSGIGDLLFLSRRRKPYGLIGDAYHDACNILKQKYASQLVALTTEFLYGDTAAFLRNYLEGVSVDAVYLLDQYAYDKGSAQSVDMLPLFRKAGVPVQRAGAVSPGALRQTLSELVPSFS